MMPDLNEKLGHLASLPRRKQSNAAGLFLREWDVWLLLILVLADVRIFQNSSVASFTLLECFAWGYCVPFLLGHLIQGGTVLAPGQKRFMVALGAYLGWVSVASVFGLLARNHSDVLQQAKNIMLIFPMVGFLCVKLRHAATVTRIGKCYLIYCIAACAVAIVQARHAGPYFRPALENNDYKLDYGGDVVGNIVLGFSGTPNELAVAVLPGAMFSMVKFASEWRHLHRIRVPTILCCATTLLVLTLAQSRGALVWFTFGLAFVAGPLRRNRSFLLKFAMVASLVITLVVHGMQADTAAIDVENTVQSRVLLWGISLDALVSDPYILVLGDGIRFVLARSWQTAGWEFPDAHNGWLDQALFFGLPALLLYLNLWYRFFLDTDEAGAEYTESSILLDGIRGTVLAYMGLYFFEPVAAAVFAASQIFLLMSCGLALACLPSHSRLDRDDKACTVVPQSS